MNFMFMSAEECVANTLRPRWRYSSIINISNKLSELYLETFRTGWFKKIYEVLLRVK